MNANSIYEVVNTTLNYRKKVKPDIYSKIDIPSEALKISTKCTNLINDDLTMIDCLSKSINELEARHA